jgi:hypothetical protein
MTAAMKAPLTGSTAALAAWYQTPTDLNDAAGKFLRDDIDNEVYRFTAYGVRDGKVIVKTPGGRCLIEVREIQGCKIMTFDFVANPGAVGVCTGEPLPPRTTHWRNLSSVADLGGRLRARPELRRDFDALFINR